MLGPVQPEDNKKVLTVLAIKTMNKKFPKSPLMSKENH